MEVMRNTTKWENGRNHKWNGDESGDWNDGNVDDPRLDVFAANDADSSVPSDFQVASVLHFPHNSKRRRC